MKKVVKILIIFLVIILIAGGGFAYAYFATDLLKSDKELFFKYLSQLSEESTEKLYEKKEQTPYENEGSLSFDVDIPEDTKIVNAVNNMTVEFSGSTDKVQNKTEKNIRLKYNDDVEFPINYIQNGELFGVQTKYIGSKYIAVENNGLQELAEKFGFSGTVIPEQIETESIENVKFTNDEIEQIKSTYGSVLKEELGKENFSHYKIVNGTSYVLTLTGEQSKSIMIKLLETLKQDKMLLDKINEYSKNFTEETSLNIDDIIADVKDTDASEIENIKKTVAQNNKKGNQIVIQYGQSSLNIKKQSDVDNLKYDITIKYADNENEYELNFVANYKGLSTLSKVTEEYSLGINLNIAGNTSKYLYTVNNNVQFKNNITIDDLNENTAVILNDRDAEYITNLFTAVTQRITEVNNSHLQELGLDTNPLIYATPIAMLGQISNDIDNQ